MNDNVMGGRSIGGFYLEDDRLVFTGSTNTDGGGFSSVRTTREQPDLDSFRALKLRVRGDGRTYTFRLGTSDSSISWWSRFSTTGSTDEDAWEEIELPFSSFWANRRGQPRDVGPLIPGDIARLGILINDKKDGHFRLEIDWIRAI